MNNRKYVCNPIQTAEVIGREYIESQIRRPSSNVDKLINSVKRINQNAYSVDGSVQKIQELHGDWNGGGNDFLNFAKSLFDGNPSFTKTLLELENIVTEAQNTVYDFQSLVTDIDNLSFQDASNALMRAYLDHTRLLLPDGVSDSLSSQTEKLPLFKEMSEALGSVYYNFIVNDKLTNIIDGVIGDVLEETGLSNMLRKDCWLRMIPEYALNFHRNVSIFQRMGTRVMPKCTYGKIYNIMDEPLAHIYNFAQDALFFLELLDNRVNIISNIIGQYRGMIMKLNSYYPVCVETALINQPTTVTIGGSSVYTDILGNPTQDVVVSIGTEPTVIEMSGK